MKITIDTQHDTYEDIRKVVAVLTHILQQKGEGLPTTPSADTSNLMSMFNDTSSTSKPASDTAPDFSSFLNLTKQEEKKSEQPQIEFY